MLFASQRQLVIVYVYNIFSMYSICDLYTTTVLQYFIMNPFLIYLKF